MSEFQVKLTEDEALVLFEYFERFDDTDDLSFRHPAEYLALMKIAGQVCKASPAIFRTEYTELLTAAQERVSAGFQGEVPCLKAQDER